MDKTSMLEPPGLEGPDYVALVIEWDEIADTIESEIESERTTPIVRSRPERPAWLTAAGVLAAVLFARWGIHRLRAA